MGQLVEYNQYHTRWRTRYERFLVAASHGDGVVTDGLEYVRTFDDGVAGLSTNLTLQRSLRSLPLYAFYRCYPHDDQDVALLTTHPRPEGRRGDHTATTAYSLSRLGPRPDLVARHCRRDAGQRLADAPGCTHLLRLLAEETDLVDLAATDDAAIADYARDRLFDDVYYTHWYKFATADTSLLPEWADRVATPAVGEEMAALAPELLVVTGERAWEAIRDYVYPVTGSSGSVTDAHGHLFAFDPEESGIELSVLPLVHLSSYWRDDRPPDSEARIRQSLERFDAESGPSP